MESSFEITLHTPSEANRRVIAGEAVGGLISSVAWADHRDELERVPGFEIASEGAVESILLLAECDFDEIERVAVTDESATSVELLRTLLPDTPFDVSRDPVSDIRQKTAGLLIGDRALSAKRARTWDLGELWHSRTGLPMVYAVFALRRDALNLEPAVRREFSAALRWSSAHLDELVSPDYTSRLDYLRRLEAARNSPRLEEGLKKFLELRKK